MKFETGLQKPSEDGFTLVELLVVVIILGILAAIAIPTFLNQREKAWQSAVKSDVRNAVVAQESHFSTAGSYSTDDSLAELTAQGFNNGSDVVFDAVTGDSTGFCMVAHHAKKSTEYWFYNSSTGEVASGAAASCTGTYS